MDALVLEPKHGAERFHEARLGEAGNADEERVAAGQERDQRKVDDAFLAENGGGCRLAHVVDFGADLVDPLEKLSFRGGKCGHGLALARNGQEGGL